jgi:lipoate-protein ligase A
VALCEVQAAALVVGSAQRPDTVDAARAAADEVVVVRRGSGGGAVHVAPGAQVWIDVWLPRHDVLWDDDVLRSGKWLGEVWARALGTLGVRDLAVHTGRATAGAWARSVCFAGLGPGEVTTGGVKLVGVAQRRTRFGARLYSMASLTWQPSSVIRLLALNPDDVARAERELAGVATGLCAALAGAGSGVGAGEVLTTVEDAFVAALP